MPRIAQKYSRRQQILEALAHMLEVSPGERITTAGLAKAVGVSEAALYRHFPSKAKMFEGLIEFVEDAIFSRLNVIMNEEQYAHQNFLELQYYYLALERTLHFKDFEWRCTCGETDRLRTRVAQFYDRLETQFRQIIRDAELKESIRPVIPLSSSVNLIMSAIEGRICQYVRSEFKRLPTEFWDEQWGLLIDGFFRETAAQSTRNELPSQEDELEISSQGVG